VKISPSHPSFRKNSLIETFTFHPLAASACARRESSKLAKTVFYEHRMLHPFASMSYESFSRGPSVGLLDFFYIEKNLQRSERGTVVGVSSRLGNHFLGHIDTCRDERRGDPWMPISVSCNILFLRLKAYTERVMRLLWAGLIQLQITFRFRDFKTWLHRRLCPHFRPRILRVPCVLDINMLPHCPTLVGGWISVECGR
jgi:hypothetical protein